MKAPDVRGEAWFTDLYTTCHAPVTRYGMRRLSSVDSARELAQEVFVVAWRRRLDVPGHALPWLYGVARRLLANYYRTERATSAPQIDTAVADEVGLVNTVVDLRAAMATLTDNDQEMLRLIGWEELSLPEAAVVLGCSRATAAVRLHRARRRLAAAMTACGNPMNNPAAVPL
ncbi:RNA polymerase sigma factor [Actinoplanes awajinensis]|uniref:RNA polymerase subunit sigma n=1 Tax=Actinoplanes awajinensis subsp. mycoplanecinus TaxID=135947 RepID=A0A117MNE6_9ACTN|nr:sigma-70 family RNA polymerase sigma factor [Actinoplanes awajinensis]KUL26904.1 hypothetical protein ADL15_36825 [Actinoplanes awajinensis subsp. mycoplanecinus]